MCNIYIYNTHTILLYRYTTLYYVARIHRCIPYGHHLMEYIRIHNITNVYIYIYILSIHTINYNYTYLGWGTHLRTQIWLICTHTPKASSAHTNLTHLYTQSVLGTHLYTHTHIPLGWGWVGGWGGDGNIPWTCIHSQLYTHTHTYLWVGVGGWVGWGW